MDQGRSACRTAHRGAPWRAKFACALILICLSKTVLGADDAPPPDALRARGILDRDTLWSGHVLITDDTTVLGATLTIAAGTLIEFAAAPNKTTGPTLTIGSEKGLPGWLTVASTHDRPIVMRTREGRPNGAMVIHARSVDRRRRAAGEEAGAAELNLSNVSFEGLGNADRPAVEMFLRDPSGLVVVDRCLLNRCGRLRVVQCSEASVDLSRNRITAPAGATALELVGGAFQHAKGAAENRAAALPVAELRVRENQIAGRLRLIGAAAEVQSNLLIGEDAAVVIEGRAGGTCVVRENFVHQVSRRWSRGAACLDCEDPDARIVGNILFGGSVVVSRGSLDMSQNVLISPGEVEGEKGRATLARAVVDRLSAGARFEGNIVIGPAHTLLGVAGAASTTGMPPGRLKPSEAATLIRRNTFDGGRVGSRGIALAAEGSCEIFDNEFRSTWPAVVDETLGAVRIGTLDYNARGEPADRAYRKVRQPEGDPHGRHDVVQSQTASLTRRELDDVLQKMEVELLAGRTDVPAALRQLRALYAPAAGSPLVGAGRPDDGGARGPIGAEGP